MRALPPLVDIHNHLIPGVDDGARSVEESVSALREMHAQGVRRVVATPHFDAEATLRPERFAERLEKMDAGWEVFRSAAAEVCPDVEVARGHEIMLDVPSFSVKEPRLRIAGGKCVLVEFPRLHVPAGAADALYRLRVEGWYPLVAHPERYVNVTPDDLSLVEEWRRVGARMIVNAGSLMGGFGKGALATVRGMLGLGWVDLVGSDYHARPGRPLLLRHTYERLSEWEGEEQAKLLLSVNPGRAMDGKEPLEVPPLELHEGVLRRIRSLFSRR